MWCFLRGREENLNIKYFTFLNDYLKILSENSSCITTNPPVPIKASLISARPGSSKVKAKRSTIIFLLMAFLLNES